jgi:outer membrane protein assembly factor BamB
MFRASRSAGLFVAISIVAAEAGFAADWPQWLGPSRNGVTSEVVPAWKEAPQVVWRKPAANGYTSPIVAEGAVILHTAATGMNGEEVAAVNARTGEPLWTDTYPRAPFRSMFGSGPRTTPTAAGGKLFTFGITGVLSCYELKTGKRLWQTNPYEAYKVPLPGFGVCSSPVVAGGRVIVMVGGVGSAVVAYDVVTGEVAWKGLDEKASSASPIVVTRGEGNDRRTEVIAQTALRIVGLSPQDGAIRWEHPMVFQPSGVSPTPLAIGSALICTTQDTGTMALELGETASPAPRSPWWKQDLTSYFSTGSAGPKGTVLVVTNIQTPLPRADLRCLDLAKGDELWRKEGLGYYHMGVITTGDGKLLILDDGGNLILADASREKFEQLAKSNICRGTMSNPALADGCIYVKDDKELICLRLAP